MGLELFKRALAGDLPNFILFSSFTFEGFLFSKAGNPLRILKFKSPIVVCFVIWIIPFNAGLLLQCQKQKKRTEIAVHVIFTFKTRTTTM